MAAPLGARIRRWLDRPFERLPAEDPTPEVLAALVLHEKHALTQVIAAALADSLADAFEAALDRRDPRAAWERLLGPLHQVHRPTWFRPAGLAAPLRNLLRHPPGAPALELPAELDGMPAATRALLAGWAGWLDERRRAHPRERRVRFPTTRPALELAAWDGEGALRLPGGAGGLRLLGPGADPARIEGRSWELAARVAAELARHALDAGFLVLSARVADGGGLEPVGGWAAKARAVAAWRSWHRDGDRLELWVAKGDRPAPEAAEFHDFAAVSKALSRRLRFARLRTPVDRLSSGRRVLRRTKAAAFLDGAALALTRFVDADGRDLEDWLADRDAAELEVIAVGPGGAGKTVSALDLYRRHPQVGLLDLGRCPPEPEAVPGWAAEQLGGGPALDALRHTPGAVVILDGLDELPAQRARALTEAIMDCLREDVRRVWIARDATDACRRIGAYLDDVPVFRARPRVTADMLAARGVPREHAAVVAPEAGTASLALARLALHLADRGARSAEPLHEWVAIVEQNENPLLQEGELAELAAKGSDWTSLARPFVLSTPGARASVFVQPLDDGTFVFRHDTWAGLYALRHLLRSTILPVAFRGLRWRAPLRHAAAELRDRPAAHSHWSPAHRARLFAWMARIEQDAVRDDWRTWRDLARDTDAAAARAGIRVVEAADTWRDARDLVGAATTLRSVIADAGKPDADWADEARLVLCRVLTEAGAIGAAIEVVLPAARRVAETAGLPVPDDPEGLVRAIDAVRGRLPDEGLRTAMHGVGALSEALSWAGAHRIAARLHGAVADYFASVLDDDERARARQVNALLGAADAGGPEARALREEARRIREEHLAQVPTATHRFFRWLLDAHLGAEAPVPPPNSSPYYAALDRRARALLADTAEAWDETAAAFQAIHRHLEAAQAGCRALRRAPGAPETAERLAAVRDALDRHAARLEALEPGDWEPATWAAWTGGADTALATWEERDALVRDALDRRAFAEAARLLPPF